MLRRGEIDIVTSATKNQQRLQEFAYSAPIGKSFAVIAVRKDDERFNYSDYKRFNGMVLGAIAGNSRNNDLAKFAQEKGFSYKLRMYDDVEELNEALEKGKVDGIISSNLRRYRNEKIVATAQPDRDPYSFVEEGKLVGIIPEYFDYLVQKAGLPYEVRIAKIRQEYESWTMGHEVDVFMDARLMLSETPLTDFYGVTTEPYMQMSMARLTRRDFTGKIKRIAVTKNQGIKRIDDDIAKDAEPVLCQSRQDEWL